MTRLPEDVDDLIKAAQRGDQAAYGQLVAPHQAELHAHCYRMLGSNAEAEDALQETLLRAWRGVAGFERRSSVRAWLYRIATNACLRVIEGRPMRVLPMDYGPAADPHDERRAPVTEAVWIEPYATPELSYEQRETVELAFVAALQHLPPTQRAVLILRDVLGFSASDTAEMLSTTPTAVYSSLQRAHKIVSERVPPQSQQATLRSLGDAELNAIVSRFVQAWQDRDVAAIVAMLTEDATFSMPPLPEWYLGSADIAAFLASRPLAQANSWSAVATRANGQLAIGHYLWDDSRDAHVAHSINVLTLREHRVSAFIAFFRPDLFPRFGLAEHVA